MGLDLNKSSNKNVVIQTIPAMFCHLNSLSVDIQIYISQLMYKLFRTLLSFHQHAVYLYFQNVNVMLI